LVKTHAPNFEAPLGLNKMAITVAKFSMAVAAVLVAVLVAAGPGRADVRAGVEAYKRGDFAAALREFVDLAEQGDPRAQYNLAVMYQNGRGVEKNPARALELQRKAANSGLAAAQHGLAVMYYRGEIIERDYAAAAKWFRRAADRGFATSQLNLGVMYFSSQGVERDDAEVVKWITLAAAKGLPEALYRLGRMYELGTIFTRSLSDAIYWYGKAGERGHEDAESQITRLTAVLAARQADKDAGGSGETAEKPILEPETPAAGPETPAARDDPPKPEVAASDPEPAPEAKPAARPWRVQLASFRTVREANLAWDELTRAFGAEFQDLRPDIVRVDLGPKRGVYHRLRAEPLANRGAAFAFCTRLKSKSPRQGCIPLSPSR
jgi:cell division septation protein DedD